LLLAGVLTVRQYFRDDQEIRELATRIYERVDFRWMLNGDPLLLSHGWKPESGFLKARWDTYSEDTILYLLAIASPTHPISSRSWYALCGAIVIAIPAMLTSQPSEFHSSCTSIHTRGSTIGTGVNYEATGLITLRNSVNATLATASSAWISRTSFQSTDQTLGVSLLQTVRKVISPGVAHREIQRSMGLLFLQRRVVR
jgi:hypothetical protein